MAHFVFSKVETITKNRQRIFVGLSLLLIGTILGGMIVGLSLSLGRSSTTDSSDVREPRDQPNVILLLADDMGYADFQVFGHPVQEWTGVDRMAQEGKQFTSWYVPSSICTPSRASMLTGRYPVRNGMFGKRFPNLGSDFSGGLPKREVTIAEALKDAGYATGMVGKWHLGINEYNSTDGSHLPIHHGFDYVGTNLPMTQMWHCDPEKFTAFEMSRYCFVYDNDTIVEQPINLQTLTSRLVSDTKGFIAENKNKPFFFFMSFPQAHAALFASPEFTGSSRRGPYGDAVNEMGWAIDEILNQLVELGIDEDTLVIFLSDNGPVRDGCGANGSNGPFRGEKVSTWEGGVRVPAIAWWPRTISPNTVSHVAVSSMDLYPTILELSGIGNYSAQNDILIDGKKIDTILKNDTEHSPHEALFFYCSDMLTAVRYKRYKIHYYTVEMLAPDVAEEGSSVCEPDNLVSAFTYLTCQNSAVKHEPPLIFDVEEDPEEHVILNPNTTENQRMLEIVADLVKSHKQTVAPVESEIDKPAKDELSPCCDPPSCVCNFDEEALPPAATEKSTSEFSHGI